MNRVIIPIIIFAGFVAGCNGDDKPPPPPPPATISMSALSWYFPTGNMPVRNPSHAGVGWSFDIPVYAHTPTTDCLADIGGCQKVGYVVTNTSINLRGKTLTATFVIETTGNPVFQYKLNPNNTCDAPASLKLYMVRVGDDMTAAKEFYRWWSLDSAVLAPGQTALQVQVASDRWSSVLGKRGNQDATTQAGFEAAIANMASVGVTFGGGCFAGHGVNISGGSAKFTMQHYGAN